MQPDIAMIRRRLQLTQRQLAERMGITQASVSRWETGEQKPSGPAAVLLRQLEAQAEALPDPAEDVPPAGEAAGALA